MLTKINGSMLEDGSVSAEKLQDEAVSGVKLAPSSVTIEKIDPAVQRRWGGGFYPTLFPGPIANTAGQQLLNPHVFTHNNRTPAPFSHEVITGHSYAPTNDQSIFAVNKRLVAISGTATYGDLGDGHSAGYSIIGYKVSSPLQYVGQSGTAFIQRIINGEMSASAWPTSSPGYDTRNHWLEEDALDIVGIIPGHTKYVLLKCGVAFAMGFSGHGQVGDGGTSNRAEWRMVGGNSAYVGAQADQRIYDGGRKIVQMCSTSNGKSAALETTFALTSDGRLWGWGYNGFGQTGTNNGITNSSETYSPHQCYRSPKSGESGVQPVTDAVYVVAAGSQYGTAIYIDANGKAWAAGNNYFNPMGTSVPNQQTYFVPCGHEGKGDWYAAYGGRKMTKVAVSGGGDFTTVLWLFDDGTVGESGHMAHGSFGGSTANSNAFRDLSASFGPSGAYGRAVNVWVNGTEYYTMFVETEDGKVYGAGCSGYGQLSNGRTTDINKGVNVVDFWAVGNTALMSATPPPRVSKLSFSGSGATTWGVCLLDDGTVYTFGYNGQGQRGATLQGTTDYWWRPFGHGQKCIDVHAGGHGAADGAILSLDENRVCWGAGNHKAVPNLYYNAGVAPVTTHMPIVINNSIGN